MDVNLVLLRRNGEHRAFPLPSNLTVIGRRHDCDLRIPLPTVSRRHCELSTNGDRVEIHDLDSTTGTFVNDERVDREAAVKAGDYIRVGPLTFVCQVDGKPEKITPPQKAPQRGAKPQKKPAKTASDELPDGLEDSFADLDASDSFIELDESDSELDDLQNI